jgi:hypothetical protein
MLVIKNEMSAVNDINLLFTKEDLKDKKTRDIIGVGTIYETPVES